MKHPAARPDVYATFGVLLAIVVLLLVVLGRSSAGVQPARGVPPFSLDEAPASQLPDAGSRAVP